jgi:hypothetical protein
VVWCFLSHCQIRPEREAVALYRKRLLFML